MLDRDFITAGKAILTVEVPPHLKRTQPDVAPHYTYKIARAKDGDSPLFVSLLTGPDNLSDFTYLGILDELTGGVRLTRASKLPAEAWPVRLLSHVCKAIFQDRGSEIERAGFAVHHEGRCGRCGRRLTVPESITTGLGPECAGRI